MSMLPITEQRLSIPYFIIYEQLNWVKVIIFSIWGNIIIGLIVYYIISPLLLFFSKNGFFKTIIDNIFNRARNKLGRIREKNKIIGLTLFIGIPLPFTGVWTGALGAYILDLPKRFVIISIILGVLISAFIVTILTLIGNEYWISFIGDEINKKLGYK
jgi:uncharacterized membrane protein